MSAGSTGAPTVLRAALALAILSVAAAVTSDGFLEADAATHFAYARYALHDPDCLVNVWARPLPTALYALPAALGGRLGVRLTSLACAIGCGLIAWRLAILQRYQWPALAAIFTFGQPVLFLHSFSEMTELPFALLAGLAFLAYRKKNWAALAIAGALLPLGRVEGFGFCLLVAAALILHRRAAWLILLPLPVALWSWSGWYIEWYQGHWWQWLIQHWPYSSSSDYARGPLLHFVYELPMLLSPAALPAVWIGCARSLDNRPRGEDHVARCQWLIAAIPLSVLTVHSLLHWLGRFSSNGELRYLLIVSPFWGLLSAQGWEWLAGRAHLRRPVAWAALAVVLPGLVNWMIPVVPIGLGPDWQSAQRLVAWYQSAPLHRDYPRLMFSHPAIDYYLNVQATDPVRSTPCTQTTIAARPPGFLLVWDADYSTKNSDSTKDVTVAQVLSAGWHRIPRPPAVGDGWQLFLSSPSTRPQPGQ
jgi:hypothetical protein